jgi:peptide/nickel transport system substrate-binding protein
MGRALSVSRGILRSVAMAAMVSLLVVSCTAGESADTDDGTGAVGVGDEGDCGTLEMAFNFDMQVPDPDIFYQADGLNVTQGAYEGLLRYEPNTEEPEIQPLLAESYDVSPDGLTYTFQLRDGVTFHDGTPFDAEAMIASFERRAAVDAGPAYMVSYIDQTEAPDPTTLVIRLAEPNSAFIHLLASPYGPKAVSPAAVEEHAEGDDQAQGWIATNSAGTGPYMIDSFQPGEYQLARFDDYWGEDPYHPACFEQVRIRVIPDFTTQALELENGGLDLMIHGIAKNDLPRFEEQGFEVFRHFGINRVTLHLNTHNGPFTDPAVRAAVPAALDRDSIVEQVWGDGAVTAEHIFPQGMLPSGVGTYDVEQDPSLLQRAVQDGGWQNATIDLTYTTDDPVNEQLAGLIAAQLTEAGLNTTARGVTQPETFDYPTRPGIRPDALVLPATPDAAHPWTWSDLFYTPGGGLAYFAPEVCAEGDDLSSAGLDAVEEEDIVDTYAQAAAAYQACGAFVPISDVAETVVARAGITGFEHEFDSLWALRLASLRDSGQG